MIYSIYKVTCKVNKKIYIGFASNYRKRKNVHKASYKTQNYKFYRAIRKYGWNNFDWSIIYQSKDKEYTLKSMENYFISLYDSFKNGYNTTLGGEGNLGNKHTEETKNKIGAVHKGKKLSEHHKEILRKNIILNCHIKEARLKSSKKRKGIKLTEEEKIKRGMRNKKSETHKKSMGRRMQNITKISCPHCNKEGQLTNMKRWHFDNCKLCPK